MVDTHPFMEVLRVGFGMTIAKRRKGLEFGVWSKVKECYYFYGSNKES